MSKPRLVAVIGLIGLCAVSVDARQQRPPSEPMASEGQRVYRIGQDGVVAPKPRHEVRPHYTADAMRQRIEGTVVLECLVQPDGTIGSVRVIRSLDAAFGLDDEAVKAARQWVFEPALKDNVPVPIIVTLSLAFKLGPRPLSFTLPESFALDAPGGASGWSDLDASVSGMSIHVSIPEGWSGHQPPDGQPLLSAQSDIRHARLIQIAGPEDSPVDLQEPRDPEQLQRLADTMTASIQSKVPGGRVLGSGQGRIGNRTWIWIEFAAGAPAELSAVAPGVPDAFRQAIDGVQAAFDATHMWMFFTTENHRRLSVTCTTFLRRGARDDERAAAVQQAGRQFAQIINRLRIESRP